MKLSGSLTVVASLLSILPITNAIVIVSSWTVTNVTSSGIQDITFPITIVEADHISGYYFAQEFSFVGLTSGGYTGIQPRPDNAGRAVLHGVFSSFIAGTTTSDANCKPGADGSPNGVSCAVEWNGVYGRKYNFEVKTSGNRLWVGTAVDSVTGQRIQIGSYTLPAGSQGIEGYQQGFVEWYPWNVREPANHCAHLPYQKTIFGNPSTTHAGSVGTQGESKEYGDCIGKVAFQTSKVAGGMQNECGFHGESG